MYDNNILRGYTSVNAENSGDFPEFFGSFFNKPLNDQYGVKYYK